MPSIEDQAAAALHIVGLILTVALGVRVWRLAHLNRVARPQRRAVLVFIAAWLVLFTASIAFHLAPVGTTRQLLRAFDVGAIFILIAASWAPLAPFRMAPTEGRRLLRILWSLAGLGIGLELAAAGMSEHHHWLHGIGFGLYLLQATIPFALYGRAMLRRLSAAMVSFIVGLMFTYGVGLFFYQRTEMPWSHVIWHLAILMGCLLSFAGMRRLLHEDRV